MGRFDTGLQLQLPTGGQFEPIFAKSAPNTTSDTSGKSVASSENMPVIPAWIVRSNFDDPRRIPYLLIWKDEGHNGEIPVRFTR
jgi:hypothetical protein